jgi:two-component system chemotaxis sensor kinase CheA
LRVELSIPLTVAALDTIRVECDGVVAAVPLEAVSQSVRLRAEDVADAASGQSVFHAGTVIPFLALSRALGRRKDNRERGIVSALIVNSSRGRLALGVDRIVGTQSVVLRKLPEALPQSRLIAGACLDALGRPELVLDPEGLRLEAAAMSGESLPAAAPRKPILVIDDSLTTRMLQQSILESVGYEVHLATCAEEGLEKARSTRYGVILCDVEMPGLDGFQFVEQKQRDPQLASVPAVLVSSRDAPEDLARGRAVGASGYIVKGRFDQRELLALITRLTGGR